MKEPIFIAACTNSGTKVLFFTLLEHKALGGVPNELHWFGPLQPNIEGRLNRLFALYPCFGTNHARESADMADTGITSVEQGRAFFDVVLEQPKCHHPLQGERYVFKDPKLALRVRWLKRCYPDGHVICLVRNPWSVAEGIVRKMQGMGDCRMKLDIPTATAQWINSTTTMLVDGDGFGRIHWLRYEDMIRAPRFPVPEDSFWGALLEKLNLPAEGFNVPNGSKFSHIDTSRDQGSASRLSQWDIDFIAEAGRGLIERFGYSKPKAG